MLVGQNATYWVVVEEEMIELLRDLIGGGKELPARQIFRSIWGDGTYSWCTRPLPLRSAQSLCR